MTMSWDLEDWLTDEGDRVVLKMQEIGYDNLTDQDKLLYEVWLLDTETRNGGISQYFCNWQRVRWNALLRLMPVDCMPTLAHFSNAVDMVIGDAVDPCENAWKSDMKMFDFYYQLQTDIVTELRSVVEAQA